MQDTRIEIRETTPEDIEDVQRLWADGDVMRFVGFPDGLHETDEEMQDWFRWIESKKPDINHYSVFMDGVYCGEAFYEIDREHGNSAAMDIKLFRFARGRGVAKRALSYTVKEAFRNGAERVWVDPVPQNAKAIALYERLGFRRKEMPEHLVPEGEIPASVYMELCRERMLNPVFESEKILFVEVSELLVKDYLVMVNDIEHVDRFIGGGHEAFTEEQEIRWVREKQQEKALVFSMIEKDTGSFIGNIELMGPSDSEGELGIALTAEKQDAGYGTEAVRAVTGYAFAKLGMKRISLRTNPDNARAIHVYEKCGFREYDRSDKHVFMEIVGWCSENGI